MFIFQRLAKVLEWSNPGILLRVLCHHAASSDGHGGQARPGEAFVRVRCEEMEHGKIENVHDRIVGEVDLPEHVPSSCMSSFMV